MNKFIVFSFVFLLSFSFVTAQVAINTDGASADASAMLDVSSDTAGLLIPRMTTGQRLTINNPANGLLVFCSDSNFFYSNRGTPSSPDWVKLNSNWINYGANINYANGKVGIGETSPSHRLTIQAAANDSAVLRLVGPNGFYGYEARLDFGDGGFVSLEEDEDDKLMIYSRLGTRITGGQVGIGTSTPNYYAGMDIDFSDRGILLPRMTNAEIATYGGSLGAAEKGMIVFNEDDIKLEYWDGSAWKTMVTKTSSTGSGSDGSSFCSEGVTDYDGHIYKTVKIGDQCWMAENLKSTTYADGSSITGHYAYDNDEGNAHTYGRLYTWAAVMNGASSSSSNPSGVQGICPIGWHVPSDAEWKELEMTVGMTTTEADGTGVRGSHSEGRKLKDTEDAFLWIDDVESGTNSSMFSALPGGIWSSAGSNFGFLSYGAYFWSSTEYSSTDAWRRQLVYDDYGVSRFYYSKASGYSIRCIKD